MYERAQWSKHGEYYTQSAECNGENLSLSEKINVIILIKLCLKYKCPTQSIKMK